MQQKPILMRFLIFGIEMVLSICLTGCDAGEIDYRVRGDFIYINQTTYTLQVVAEYSFTLAPEQSYTINQDGDGGKIINAESYVPPISDAVLIFNNVKCDTLLLGSKAGQGEGPAGIENYESKKLKERHYEFTYRFTLDDYGKTQDCQ